MRPSSKMTAALAAMNAEDFMIGTPPAPTALGVDYLIVQIDPDPGIVGEKSRLYLQTPERAGHLTVVGKSECMVRRRFASEK